MKSDEEFDAYLAGGLDEASLPDQGFTGVVAARIERHRRQRRAVMAAASAAASVVAAVALYFSPVPVISSSTVTPQAISATLVLVAVCSVVWIETESTTWRAQ